MKIIKQYLAILAVLLAHPLHAQTINGQSATVAGVLPNGLSLACISSTGSDTFTCTVSTKLAYSNGMLAVFRPTGAACTGPATVNMSSKGARKLFAADGTSDPECEQNKTYIITYNSGLDSGTGGWTMPGAAGSTTSVHYTIFRSIAQNTVVGTNFSLPSENAPTLTVVEGASSGDPSTASSAWNYGTLSFAANTGATANSVQGAVFFPSTWDSSAGVTVSLKWRTSATTGNVVFSIQGQCISSGEIPGNFGAATNFTASAANGTTLRWTTAATLTLTTANVLSGCAASDTFLFRLYRDHSGSDTLATAAELVSAEFGAAQ